MAIYKDPRKTIKVSIPNIEGSEVEIYDNFLWGDVETLIDSKKSDIENGLSLLKVLIKDWNLTNENGEKLPITEDTFKTFTIDIINFLLSKTKVVKGESLEEKKTD